MLSIFRAVSNKQPDVAHESDSTCTMLSGAAAEGVVPGAFKQFLNLYGALDKNPLEISRVALRPDGSIADIYVYSEIKESPTLGRLSNYVGVERVFKHVDVTPEAISFSGLTRASLKVDETGRWMGLGDKLSGMVTNADIREGHPNYEAQKAALAKLTLEVFSFGHDIAVRHYEKPDFNATPHTPGLLQRAALLFGLAGLAEKFAINAPVQASPQKALT